MTNLSYVIACDQVSTDQHTGKLSLIGIFTTINGTNFPALHPQLTIVTRTEGNPGIHTQKIEIINLKDNKVIIAAEKPFEIKEDGGNNFIANFGNILFQEPGEYWIKVTIDGQSFSDKTLHKIKVKKA